MGLSVHPTAISNSSTYFYKMKHGYFPDPQVHCVAMGLWSYHYYSVWENGNMQHNINSKDKGLNIGPAFIISVLCLRDGYS